MLSGFSLWGNEFPAGESSLLLAGISGGVDSMVLLEHLWSLFGDRIVVCHINHGLRGEESDGDEKMVREEAERRGLVFLTLRGDVNQLSADRGISVELAAREFRKECFEKWADEVSATVLFLAHHANDQAETVLFNLCRGGGARGIRRTHERDSGLLVIRPLLTCAREEIVQYARENGIQWREDSTNAHPVATRNRLRLEALPLLEDIMQRSVVRKLAQAGQLENERAMALDEAMEILDLLDSQGRLYLPKVNEMGESLRKAVIHWYLRYNRVTDISRELVDGIESILSSDSPAKMNLPGNRFARRKEKRLFIE